MYKPREQGRKDARQGKPRYPHQSEWNQRQYDRGYEEGLREVALRPEPKVEEPSYAELKQQRDELKETLDVAIAAAQKAEKELIECMRQRDELLAAAVAIRADLVRRAEFDSEDGGAVLNISNGVLMQLDAAIAKVKP